MPNNSRANKRIAKNTLVIYANLFLNMLIGVISSRFVLQALGVSDFGLYNVAGGIALFFAFISNALSSTTTRFVNVEMGKPNGDVNRVFNVCRLLHIAMAVFVLILIEIGGVWYINHYLNVEFAKTEDAMFVFQTAAVVLCLGVINVPFSSLFNATEKFFFSSMVSVVGKLIEFGLVIWLLTYSGNRLRMYAIIMTTATVVPFVVYHVFCYLKWPGYVKWRFVREWSHYKEVLAYSNFNLLSGAAGMARNQGAALLINYFFGTTVNGAYAVAKHMERHLALFAHRFQDAAAPQITQNYTNGNHDRVYYLTSRIGKYTMLITMIAFFPLWSELGLVLDIWLAKVPEGALTFCRLILLLIMVSVTDGGIGHVINASGKVARFRMAYSLLLLLCIPIGFITLKAGASPYILLILFIVADVIFRISQLWMVHRVLQFPVWRYCMDVYLPVALVFMVMTLCLFLTSLAPWDSMTWHLCRFGGILLLTVGVAFYVGLRKSERDHIILQVKNRLSHV